MFGPVTPVTPVRPHYINPTNMPLYCSTVTMWFYGHTSAYICSDGPVLFYLPYFYDSTLYSILYITLHAAI